MKTFIINLEKDLSRRRAVVEQCVHHHLPHEIIDAIDGRMLSGPLLATLTDNYPSSFLTKGEIGCALSHLRVYAKMIAGDIPYALVMEDDAVLSASLKNWLEAGCEVLSNNRPEIILLTGNCTYNKYIAKKSSQGHRFHRVTHGSAGHGYIVNAQAAKLIINANLPIKFEADRWMMFRDLEGIRVWCSQEAAIRSACVLAEDSTIGSERLDVAYQRGKVIKKRKKEARYYQLKRVKNLLLSKFFTEKIH